MILSVKRRSIYFQCSQVSAGSEKNMLKRMQKEVVKGNKALLGALAGSKLEEEVTSKLVLLCTALVNAPPDYKAALKEHLELSDK